MEHANSLHEDGAVPSLSLVSSADMVHHFRFHADFRPCVCSQQVFLTTADEASGQQQLLCYGRASGQQRWNRVVHEGGLMRMHNKNSHASATPACDGQHVYTVFINGEALKVTAFSLDGELAWQKDAGPFKSEHGYGSSPVIYGLIIVLGDNLSGSFLAALDRGTGEIVWRTARKTSGRHGSYATPIVAEVAGKPQLLVTGSSQVTSYDPATGKLIWFCEGPAEVTACTMACDDQSVFASGGYPENELLAIRADGQGDVTDSHIAWRTHKGVTYVPSPLCHDGRLFVVNDEGIATCFQADTGKQLGRKRLDGEFSSSPMLCNGLIYVSNEAGKTFVVKADPTLQKVGESDLGDGGFASPAICGGQIFLRTLHRLYCIGQPAPSSW